MEFINKCTNGFAEDRKLGEGGFGVFYKGKDDNRYFAVKRTLFDIAVKEDKVKEVRKSFKLNWR